MEMKLVMEVGDETHPVTVSAEENIYHVRLGDELYVIDVRRSEASPALSMLVSDQSVEAWAVSHGGGYDVTVLGETFSIDVEDALRAGLKKLSEASAVGRAEIVKAPMPGVVVEIKSAVGDVVEAGQAVVIVEAMKMRNEFGPKHAGVLEKIAVKVGQSVERGSEMFVVAPPATDGE